MSYASRSAQFADLYSGVSESTDGFASSSGTCRRTRRFFVVE
jgi:hypothetical protein